MNSIVDLALIPSPVVAVDGFVNAFFNTGPSGIGGFNVTVPPTGTPPTGVPIGLQLSLQCLMGDPFNQPFGVALTAATKITTTQGPTIQYYNLGGDTNTTITPRLPDPVLRLQLRHLLLCSNGFLTFGSPDSQVRLHADRQRDEHRTSALRGVLVRPRLRRQPGEGHDGHEPGRRHSEVDARRLHERHRRLLLARGDTQLRHADAR